MLQPPEPPGQEPLLILEQRFLASFLTQAPKVPLMPVRGAPSSQPKGNPKESCSLHKQLAAAGQSSGSVRASVYFRGSLGLSLRVLNTTDSSEQ